MGINTVDQRCLNDRTTIVDTSTSVLKNDVTKKLLLARRLLLRERPLQSRWGGGGIHQQQQQGARENVCYEVRPGEPAATCAAAAATMD